MAIDLEQMLEEMLGKVRGSRERDDLEARFKALEERKPDLKLTDVLTALEQASDEELAALESSALGDLVRQAREAEAAGAAGSSKPAAGATDETVATGKAARRTRPGRKSGQAYGWWIDDDGEVEKIDIARVYTGEDEPDEVELPPRTEEPEVEGGDGEEADAA